MNRTRKVVSLLLLTLFLTPLVTLETITVHAASSRTLVVPDQYPTIQDAVNNASAGDTVFVKSGVYYNETIDINKALNLVGENPDTTCLIGYGKGYPYSNYNYTVIWVNSFEINSSTDFSISNFTIENAVVGIYILGDYSDGKIVNCNLLNNSVGIQIDGLGYQDIPDEYADNHIELSGNIIMDNSGSVDSADAYLNIYNNTITRNSSGLGFWSDTVDVAANVISYNRNFESGVGLSFGPDCFNCLVENNVIQGNYIGVWLEGFPTYGSGVPVDTAIGKNNQVTENNFLNNTSQVKVDPTSYDTGTDVFSWDGNYWSDYNGNGSYVINENNIDHNPLTQQVNMYTMSLITLTTFLIMVAIVVAVIVIISILLFRRHQKTAKV